MSKVILRVRTVLQAVWLLSVLVVFPSTDALSDNQSSGASSNNTGQFEYEVRNVILTTYPGHGPKAYINATLGFKIRNITSNDVRVALITASTTALRLDSGQIMQIESAGVSGVSSCPWAEIRSCEQQADNYVLIRGGKSPLSGSVKFIGNLGGNKLGAPVVATLSGELFVQDLKSGKAWKESFTVEDIPLQNNSGQ